MIGIAILIFISFFEKVTAISGILRPQMAKTEKRDIIAKQLALI